MSIVARTIAPVPAPLVLPSVSPALRLLAVDSQLSEGHASGKRRGYRRDREKLFHPCSPLD